MESWKVRNGHEVPGSGVRSWVPAAKQGVAVGTHHETLVSHIIAPRLTHLGKGSSFAALVKFLVGPLN